MKTETEILTIHIYAYPTKYEEVGYNFTAVLSTQAFLAPKDNVLVKIVEVPIIYDPVKLVTSLLDAIDEETNLKLARVKAEAEEHRAKLLALPAPKKD